MIGGASRRMGRDKATLVVGGRALGAIAADALRGGGAEDVFAVGGEADTAAGLGLAHVRDQWPGEGPVGAIVTALLAARHDRLVVLSCDLPDVTAATVGELLAALDDADDAALARAGGRVHPLLAVYRAGTREPIERAFRAGERAVMAALSPLRVKFVDLSVTDWARNVNFPHDLG